MAKKDNSNFFAELEIQGQEEALKEIKKQKTLLIIKSIGTAMALIGTLIILFRGKTNDPLLYMGIGGLIGVTGELLACLFYKLFVFIGKVFLWWASLIPIIGIFIGICCCVILAIYVPVFYAVLSLIETIRNYKEAMEYTEDFSDIAEEETEESVE